MEILQICRACGLEKWVPPPTFYAYTTASRSAVSNVMVKLCEKGIIKKKGRGIGLLRKVNRNPTLWEMYELFAPSLLPPSDRSCNGTLRRFQKYNYEFLRINHVFRK
jgi:hypothetical protein